MAISTLKTLAAAVKYRTYEWLPSYWRHMRGVAENRLGPDNHVILTFVDHFEPSRRAGERGVEAVGTWCDAYAELVKGFTDSDGRVLQHTWFYRFDYPNDDCMRHIAQATYRGLGEIEFHLHHGNDTRESFARTIEQGVAWFNRWGAMLGFTPERQQSFAYIAGNWALDNGQGDDSKSGVNDEIGVLGQRGCYADFTFPAFGERSQPKLVNSIYYAKAGPEPKSYDTGMPLSARTQVDGDLLIFQGPMLIDFLRGVVDYAAFESYAPYRQGRLQNWIRSWVHVEGRPEWVFVKIHTHGMQSRDAVLGPQLTQLLSDAQQVADETGAKFHFANAREAYNIAVAAAEGQAGDPGQFRDWKIAAPVNRFVSTSRPVNYREAGPGCVDLVPEGGRGPLDVDLSTGPVGKVSGESIERLRIDWDAGNDNTVRIEGDGQAELRRRNGSGTGLMGPETIELPAQIHIG